MPATAPLMMKPEDKQKLVASARTRKLSAAELARPRLLAAMNPEEQMFLDAVVDLGNKVRRVCAEADARESRETAARAAQQAREVVLGTRIEAAFATARADRGRASAESARSNTKPQS